LGLWRLHLGDAVCRSLFQDSVVLTIRSAAFAGFVVLFFSPGDGIDGTQRPVSRGRRRHGI
jgi:hypothetical protein